MKREEREEREEREREKKTHTKSSTKYIYANGTSTILNYSIIIYYNIYIILFKKYVLSNCLSNLS